MELFRRNPTYVTIGGVAYSYALAADGVTDDTALLQAAIDTGDSIILPRGQILVSSIDLNTTISMRGPGYGETFLVPSADQNCVRLNEGGTVKVSNIHLSDFSIAPKTNRTAGACLVLGNIGKSYIENIKITNALGGTPFIGTLVENASNTRMLSDTAGCSSDGIKFAPNAVALTGIVGFHLLDGSEYKVNGGHGINITNASTTYACEGIYIGVVETANNIGNGVHIRATAGTVIKHIFLTGTIIDTNTSQGLLVNTGAAVLRVLLKDVWCANNGLAGIYFTAAGQDCEVKGGQVLRNNQSGIVCDAADNITLSDIRIYNNGVTTTNTYPCIEFKNTPTNIQVLDCVSFNSAEWAGQQRGILITTGTDITIVGGMCITGTGSLPFTDSGTRTVCRGFMAGETYATAVFYNTQQAINTTAVGNITTGEDDLQSYALPLNALNYNGRGVRITAWGTSANNANAKTIKLYFGSVAILTHVLTVSQVNTWRITAEVFRTGVDAQDYVSQLIQGGTATAIDAESGSLTQDDGAAITIKCTGEGVATNDIVQDGLLVEYL